MPVSTRDWKKNEVLHKLIIKAHRKVITGQLHIWDRLSVAIPVIVSAVTMPNKREQV